jgi:hypothetical protein
MSAPHAPQEPNPFAAGAEAARKGKNVHTANPYIKGSREYIRWVNGFRAAQMEVINDRPLPQWVHEGTEVTK